MVRNGSLDELAKSVPGFARRPFALGGAGEAAHPRFDMIVREARPDGGDRVPVGVVSKRYRLVQHGDLIRALQQALSANGIGPPEAEGELRLSEFGARMALALVLPDRYGFDPGDGHRLGLRLLVVNSVDGSCGLRFLLGWYRFVCCNGLVVGTTRLKCHFAHRQSLAITEVGDVLRRGITLAREEQASLRAWLAAPVARDELARWVDGPVRRSWGVKAAVRAWHICATGHDAELVRTGQRAPPHRRAAELRAQVPGSPRPATNAYHVSQALAWLAKERRDVEESLEWMAGIPGLMRSLVGRRSGPARG
ncbi:MAG TPA: DUF932 domain-containing protein [Burkholderiales bacterium]